MPDADASNVQQEQCDIETARVRVARTAAAGEAFIKPATSPPSRTQLTNPFPLFFPFPYLIHRMCGRVLASSSDALATMIATRATATCL